MKQVLIELKFRDHVGFTLYLVLLSSNKATSQFATLGHPWREWHRCYSVLLETKALVHLRVLPFLCEHWKQIVLNHVRGKLGSH